MRTQTYLLVMLVGLVFMGVGCSSQNQNAPDQSQQTENVQEGQEAASSGRALFQNNTKEATIDDVAIGGALMAIGTQNSDGSVSADRIIIANANTDFSSFDQGFRSDGGTPPEGDGSSGAQRTFQPTDGTAGNFDPSQFQNMTQEQRDALRQQFQDQRGQNGGTGGRGFTGAGQSGGRVMGTVLKKDDESIVVSLSDGGSKIIFYSDSTTISRITQETSQNSNQPTSGYGG